MLRDAIRLTSRHTRAGLIIFAVLVVLRLALAYAPPSPLSRPGAGIASPLGFGVSIAELFFIIAWARLLVGAAPGSLAEAFRHPPVLRFLFWSIVCPLLAVLLAVALAGAVGAVLAIAMGRAFIRTPTFTGIGDVAAAVGMITGMVWAGAILPGVAARAPVRLGAALRFGARHFSAVFVGGVVLGLLWALALGLSGRLSPLGAGTFPLLPWLAVALQVATRLATVALQSALYLGIRGARPQDAAEIFA